MSEQQPLFRIVTTCTRKFMQKTYQASMSLWRTAFVLAMAVILLSSFAFFFILCIDDLSMLPFIGWFSLAYAIYLIIDCLWLRCFLAARRFEKRMQELYPDQTQQLTIHAFEDHMEAATSLTEQTEQIDYGCIIRVKETKELILLFRKQRLFYQLEKTGFEQGSAPEFIAFLKEKIPAAKFNVKK